MDLDKLVKQSRETAKLGAQAYSRVSKELEGHRGKFVTINVHTDEYVITDTAAAGMDKFVEKYDDTTESDNVFLFTMEIPTAMH